MLPSPKAELALSKLFTVGHEDFGPNGCLHCVLKIIMGATLIMSLNKMKSNICTFFIFLPWRSCHPQTLSCHCQNSSLLAMKTLDQMVVYILCLKIVGATLIMSFNEMKSNYGTFFIPNVNWE